MAKKDSNATINFAPASNQEKEKLVVNNVATPLLESEAYVKPQFDEGSDTTILKVVGRGGPVPIIAPKHNTIQLQPIIVPLAVVPYMTQDSGVLRTDGRASVSGNDMSFAETTNFERLDNVGLKKQSIKSIGLKPRMFAFIIFLLSAYTVLPFILAKFYTEIGGSYTLSYLNIIDTIIDWMRGVDPTNMAVQILYIIGAFLAGITVIVTFLSLIVGKFPKTLSCILTLLSSMPLLAVLIYKVVKKEFMLEHEVAFVSVVAVSLFAFVLSSAFAIVLNHDQDKREAFNDSLI